MSSSSSPPTTTSPTVFLLLLFTITYLPSSTIAQSNSPLMSPTIAECGARILPLALCAPYVQGVSTTPTQLCCDNLMHVNEQQPRCLCLLVNNSGLSLSFPINTTLAMQLPLICSVHFDIVSCTSGAAPLPSMSPTPQVSLGSTANSTVASSPMARGTPKSGFMGVGFHPNYAMKIRGSLQLRMMVVLTILTCISTSMLY